MPAFVIQASADFPGPLTQSLDFGPDPFVLSFPAVPLTGGGPPVNQINVGTFTAVRVSGDVTANPGGAAGVLQFANIGWFRVRLYFDITNGVTAGVVAAKCAAGTGVTVMGGDALGVESDYANASVQKSYRGEWIVYSPNANGQVTLTVGGPNGVSTVNGGVLVEQIG